MGEEVMYAGYPAPYVYAEPDGEKAVQQLLWGDWVSATDQRRNGFRFLERARNSKGWIREDDLIPDRLLEVAFVDVGQGDGCLVTTPGDRRILIDAGVGSEMYWYLRWRFDLRDRPPDAEPLMIDHAVISHPDEDHYAGFGPILDAPQIAIGILHHNGIVHRPGPAALGPTTTSGSPRRLTQLLRTRDEMAELLADPANVGRSRYPNLMKRALANGLVGDVRMLSAADGHLPGYDGSGDGPEGDEGLVIDVLGPVVEEIEGTPTLRRLGNTGVTKNGHSVVLRLRLGDVTIGLGGDLNVPAQRFLLQHHCDVDCDELPGLDPDARAAAVADARAVFQVDVAKACHHGSSDVEDVFMEATNAIATVISSGDEEQHSHPRPDALGLVGRYGRGNRPLLFSTELARSHRSFLERPGALAAKEAEALEAARLRADAGADEVQGGPEDVAQRFQRAVTVYGLITLRTDGERVLLAQKLERSRGATSFDHYALEPAPDGGLAWNPDA